MTERIEDHLRTDEDLALWQLVVRGRPLSVEALLLAAGRARAEFTWRDEPFSAVSAEVTGPSRSLDQLLSGKALRTRVTYASAPVVIIVAAGFPVLATFAAPHVSIFLPEYDAEHADALRRAFGPEHRNPYHGGRS